MAQVAQLDGIKQTFLYTILSAKLKQLKWVAKSYPRDTSTQVSHPDTPYSSVGPGDSTNTAQAETNRLSNTNSNIHNAPIPIPMNLTSAVPSLA